MVDKINGATAIYSARRSHFAVDALHRGPKHFWICDAHDFDIRQLTHSPGRVVVDILLRIVWRPVLIIEESISNATVWLVHAHEVAARCELTRSRSRATRRRGRG